jgi:hypothetical protein
MGEKIGTFQEYRPRIRGPFLIDFTLDQERCRGNSRPLPILFQRHRQRLRSSTWADREVDLFRKELSALKKRRKGLVLKLLTGQASVKLPTGGV